MGISSGFEANSLGGGYAGGLGIGGAGYGGGGFGGFGLFGLLGLKGIGDLDGNRRRDDDGPGRNELATLQAISNAKDTTVAEGRSLAAAICDSEKTNLQQFYAGAIQAANNTQAIKDQATAFAIVNDKRFDDLSAAGVAQTAAIIARINQAEVDSLRDQLNHSHRKNDSQDVTIAISNSNSQVQAQLQAQAQVQTQRDFDNVRRFDAIFGSFNQLNKNTSDVINFGTMAASANQANQQTNVK